MLELDPGQVGGRRTLRRVVAVAALLAAACHHQHDGPSGDADLGMDGSADLGGPACATQSTKAELAPLDLLLLLDTSASMDYQGKWTSVKGAVKAFVQNPQATGLGLGLQYYPLRATCNVDDYSVPGVTIQVLPTGATDVVTSMKAKQMSGGTPMVPAFEGVYKYLKQRAADNPKHKVVMVLASDGAPDDSCIAAPMGELPNSLANATQLAMTAYTADPPVSTFVIGVGSETSVLEQIATAGGGKAIFVDTSTDIQGAFLAALNEIRGNALTCQFDIPAPSDDQMLDYDRVNVVFTASDISGQSPLVFVGTKDKCDQAPNKGWYYDDPSAPQKVVLCTDACGIATQSTTGRIDVVFGCKTNVL